MLHTQAKQNKEFVFKYSVTFSEPPHLAVHISYFMQKNLCTTALPQIPDNTESKSCF